jgi:hypothetical protein
MKVSHAHGKAEVMRRAAIASIDSRGIRPGSKKAPWVQSEGDLKAPRAVLRVLSEEYGKIINLSPHEFRQAMRDEIEGASNSLELHDSQRQLPDAEFSNLPVRFIRSKVSSTRIREHSAFDETGASE